MDPWWAKGAVLIASAVLIAIRAPHGQRSRTVAIATNRRGTLETALLTLAWLSFFVPLLWIATPWLAFADYPLRPLPFVTGVACFALGLWLFHRSHADLGSNWSITLQLREQHRLVTHGIYTRVRHPMYLALLLHSLGQALALPNWIAGPSYGVAMGVLVALRLRPEERMMREQFGADWDAYAARTKRLVPGVW
jgi:protein-S-isoprenylcysteine O-methyltransferase Ste14